MILAPVLHSQKLNSGLQQLRGSPGRSHSSLGKGSQGNPIRPTWRLLGATGPYKGLLGRRGSLSLGSNGFYELKTRNPANIYIYIYIYNPVCALCCPISPLTEPLKSPGSDGI